MSQQADGPPRRPLCGFTLFFHLQRKRLLQYRIHDVDSLQSYDNDNQEEVWTVEEIAHAAHSKYHHSPKRKHDKIPGGSLPFHTLREYIGKKWKAMKNTPMGQLLEQQALSMREDYHQASQEWKRANRKKDKKAPSQGTLRNKKSLSRQTISRPRQPAYSYTSSKEPQQIAPSSEEANPVTDQMDTSAATTCDTSHQHQTSLSLPCYNFDVNNSNNNNYTLDPGQGDGESFLSSLSSSTSSELSSLTVSHQQNDASYHNTTDHHHHHHPTQMDELAKQGLGCDIHSSPNEEEAQNGCHYKHQDDDFSEVIMPLDDAMKLGNDDDADDDVDLSHFGFLEIESQQQQQGMMPFLEDKDDVSWFESNWFQSSDPMTVTEVANVNANAHLHSPHHHLHIEIMNTNTHQSLYDVPGNNCHNPNAASSSSSPSSVSPSTSTSSWNNEILSNIMTNQQQLERFNRDMMMRLMQLEQILLQNSNNNNNNHNNNHNNINNNNDNITTTNNNSNTPLTYHHHH